MNRACLTDLEFLGEHAIVTEPSTNGLLAAHVLQGNRKVQNYFTFDQLPEGRSCESAPYIGALPG